MALREFFDRDGVRWKAWDVTADQIHPKTRAEDYMHDLVDGWLVFERTDAEEKRRLCPYPAAWEESSDDELLALWQQAEKVRRRSTPPIGSWKVGDAPVPPTMHREKPATPKSDIPRRPGDKRTDSGDEEKEAR
jgi:hypothetical protein